MDQQLRLGEPYLPKSYENDTSIENQLTQNGEEGTVSDYEIHPELNSEVSDATTLEQRRAYKIEMQVETVYYFIMLYTCFESIKNQAIKKCTCLALITIYPSLCRIMLSCFFCMLYPSYGSMPCSV